MDVIERLYIVFGNYPLRGTIESCPCCGAAQHARRLHTVPLRELTADDLAAYAFRAMTTVGDVSDFKHFLPRLLELIGLAGFPIDKEVVFGKLQYGKWREWPATERAAVEAYLDELWTRARRRTLRADPSVPEEIGSWLCALARAEANLGNYLDAWADDSAPEAHANLLRFLDEERSALDGTTSPNEYWEDCAGQWRQVQVWARRCEESVRMGHQP